MTFSTATRSEDAQPAPTYQFCRTATEALVMRERQRSQKAKATSLTCATVLVITVQLARQALNVEKAEVRDE